MPYTRSFAVTARTRSADVTVLIPIVFVVIVKKNCSAVCYALSTLYNCSILWSYSEIVVWYPVTICGVP